MGSPFIELELEAMRLLTTFCETQVATKVIDCNQLTSFIPLVRFQWVIRLILSEMSVGPLFPVDRTGHLVCRNRQVGSRVQEPDKTI